MSAVTTVGSWTVLTNGDGAKIHSSWTNGTVRVTDKSIDGVRQGTMKAIADETADLARHFPTYRRHVPHVTILPSDDDVFYDPQMPPDSEAYVAGSTRTGTATISINERDLALKNWDGNPLAMPAAQRVEAEWMYTLAHEFGHAITPWNEERKIIKLGQSVIMYVSPYGKQSQWECFAECFAEYYMSHGETTNRAAIAFAIEFGWVDHLPHLRASTTSPR